MARFILSDNDRATITAGVSCALLLERHGYALDKKDSTRRNPKYRAGKGETIILNHEGKGWWDPGSEDRGDVFALLRRLQPELSFRDVCMNLAQLVGIEPEGAVWLRTRPTSSTTRSPAERWADKRAPFRRSKVWRYLAEERCLPDWVIRRAAAVGVLRDGFHAAWFAHQDVNGAVCGAELRGPETHLCLAGSVKTLFRFKPDAGDTVRRLVVCESAIDALSCAVLDTKRTRDTLYVSTAGGMGPETLVALKTMLTAMQALPGAELVIATDDDPAGDAFADRLYDLGYEAGLEVDRFLPPDRAKDFNQTLKNLAGESVAA